MILELNEKGYMFEIWIILFTPSGRVLGRRGGEGVCCIVFVYGCLEGKIYEGLDR